MSCQAYDTAFRQSEQQISASLITNKFKLGPNAYWGRVPDAGMFPLNSGTSIKKIRLNRIGFGTHENGWINVVDTGCANNLCSNPPAETIGHGTKESFYGLQKFMLATDPICLALLPFRQMPEKELAHFEQHLQMMTRYTWDEYMRFNYINTSTNKFVAMVSDAAISGDLDTCDTLERSCAPQIRSNDGFVFWNRPATGGVPVLDSSLPIDERYISVNIPVSKIPNITELSGDLLETAAINLDYEDDSRPFIDEGIDLMEVNVPDVRVMRRLIQLERMQESDCSPLVAYQGKDLSLRLGIKKVIREMFGLRRDYHGMKFYPDDLYNSTLEDADYDANDPATWPRFRRVFAYVPQQGANGTMDYVVNPYFLNAPFGISTIFTKAVMSFRHHPEAQNYGSATKGELARNYAGTAKWKNEYDKICNPNQEIGNWELHFGGGIEPERPELGNVFFHRIDHSISLKGNKCPISLLGCGPYGITNDCFTELVTGEASLGLTAGDRGANVVSVMNSMSQGFFM